jgi:hypothetical protein
VRELTINGCDVVFGLIMFRGGTNDYCTVRDVALTKACVGSPSHSVRDSSCVIGGGSCRVVMGSACPVCRGHHSMACGCGSYCCCYDGSLRLSDYLYH